MLISHCDFLLTLNVYLKYDLIVVAAVEPADLVKVTNRETDGSRCHGPLQLKLKMFSFFLL